LIPTFTCHDSTAFLIKPNDFTCRPEHSSGRLFTYLSTPLPGFATLATLVPVPLVPAGLFENRILLAPGFAPFGVPLVLTGCTFAFPAEPWFAGFFPDPKAIVVSPFILLASFL
jgi:hypothetical protein